MRFLFDHDVSYPRQTTADNGQWRRPYYTNSTEGASAHELSLPFVGGRDYFVHIVANMTGSDNATIEVEYLLGQSYAAAVAIPGTYNKILVEDDQALNAGRGYQALVKITPASGDKIYARCRSTSGSVRISGNVITAIDLSDHVSGTEYDWFEESPNAVMSTTARRSNVTASSSCMNVIGNKLFNIHASTFEAAAVGGRVTSKFLYYSNDFGDGQPNTAEMRQVGDVITLAHTQAAQAGAAGYGSYLKVDTLETSGSNILKRIASLTIHPHLIANALWWQAAGSGGYLALPSTVTLSANSNTTQTVPLRALFAMNFHVDAVNIATYEHNYAKLTPRDHNSNWLNGTIVNDPYLFRDNEVRHIPMLNVRSFAANEAAGISMMYQDVTPTYETGLRTQRNWNNIAYIGYQYQYTLGVQNATSAHTIETVAVDALTRVLTTVDTQSAHTIETVAVDAYKNLLIANDGSLHFTANGAPAFGGAPAVDAYKNLTVQAATSLTTSGAPAVDAYKNLSVVDASSALTNDNVAVDAYKNLSVQSISSAHTIEVVAVQIAVYDLLVQNASLVQTNQDVVATGRKNLTLLNEWLPVLNGSSLPGYGGAPAVDAYKNLIVPAVTSVVTNSTVSLTGTVNLSASNATSSTSNTDVDTLAYKTLVLNQNYHVDSTQTVAVDAYKNLTVQGGGSLHFTANGAPSFGGAPAVDAYKNLSVQAATNVVTNESVEVSRNVKILTVQSSTHVATNSNVAVDAYKNLSVQAATNVLTNANVIATGRKSVIVLNAQSASAISTVEITDAWYTMLAANVSMATEQQSVDAYAYKDMIVLNAPSAMALSDVALEELRATMQPQVLTNEVTLEQFAIVKDAKILVTDSLTLRASMQSVTTVRDLLSSIGHTSVIIDQARREGVIHISGYLIGAR
jgi:hypothetical protein